MCVSLSPPPSIPTYLPSYLSFSRTTLNPHTPMLSWLSRRSHWPQTNSSRWTGSIHTSPRTTHITGVLTRAGRWAAVRDNPRSREMVPKLTKKLNPQHHRVAVLAEHDGTIHPDTFKQISKIISLIDFFLIEFDQFGPSPATNVSLTQTFLAWLANECNTSVLIDRRLTVQFSDCIW